MSGMHILLRKLVSQAEEEGLPLAQIMARELSATEIDRLQDFLTAEMTQSYAAIADFMRDVEVPDTYDFTSMNEAQLDLLQEELMFALSDSQSKARSEA
ncbi:MAG: hypothetical protein JSV94_06405 [Methanobacteriota archaeon]|nr:MAG: hypothetical protein JSV94_06405 [Euryarchaeota archaeon]